MLESLDLPFVQRGLAEVAILSVGAGLIGTWVVLRGLAFFSHAVGTAAFPGLVVADGLGFAAPLGALGAALVFAGVMAALPRRGDDRGSETALILVGMLALGVILASDVFGSSAAIESLLFGSLFLIGPGDLALAAVVSIGAIAAAVLFGRHWVAIGFDGGGDSSSSRRSALDAALVLLIALATAASLGAVGALLVAALFVVPAATTRLWCSRMGTWQLATVALCLVTGCLGVVLSVELNTPPGATIAVLSGAFFAISALVAAARNSGRRAPLARLAAAVAAILVVGCGSDSGETAPSVVATTPVVADLAANVAGADAEVVGLLGANTDPHDYEPRPDEIRALAEADLVLASGGDLDDWIAGALEDAGSEATLVVLAEVIPKPLYDGDGELDPHWWHDPRNAVAAVGEIGERLGSIDASRAASFERRADAYGARISELDASVESCMKRIPERERKLVTNHDSFAYLARRYGIELVGTVIPALTTEAQPSAGELADLRKAIEREGVRAVFPESSSDDGLAEVISAETGTNTGSALFGDSLGPEDSLTGTYLGMEAANAASLVSGLTGGRRDCNLVGQLEAGP